MNLGFWNFYKQYNANRMFDSSESELGDNLAAPTVFMAKRLRELGHQVNTLDKTQLNNLDAAVFFDHPTIFNRYYREVRRLGIPMYLFLNENPMNRPDNYWPDSQRSFAKVFTWQPVGPIEPDDCAQWRGESIGRPQRIEFRLPVSIPVNAQRGLLPPHEFNIGRTYPRKTVCAVWSQKYSSHEAELYSERVKAIRWFWTQHHRKDFDLYGKGWDRCYFTGIASRLNPLLARLYSRLPGSGYYYRWPLWAGEVKSKLDTLICYKFTLAYENAVFPGYVTEKIFDAMFAGCVPIYLGAPDITDYVPAEAFIDKRKFATYEDLYDYLRNMERAEYDGYLDAIEAFILGPRFKPFTSEAFTALIIQHIIK